MQLNEHNNLAMIFYDMDKDDRSVVITLKNPQDCVTYYRARGKVHIIKNSSITGKRVDAPVYENIPKKVCEMLLSIDSEIRILAIKIVKRDYNRVCMGELKQKAEQYVKEHQKT
jgi:hypothetical protein